jgi:2-polyprenyl-3-methyl-5-hydroxy-6-metoxy-1,4-benzoquinol methylase
MDGRDSYRQKITQLVENEKARTCGPESAKRYETEHHIRFLKTVEVCTPFVPDPSSTVLDVGRSALTVHLASRYKNVWSMGFDPASDQGGHREADPLSGISHLVFDLNASHDCARWPESPTRFDLILFAETVEHIYTAPQFSLLMLSSLLKPNGYLVVTTPNAVSLSKRINLLLGRNPYEMIRYFPQNPGHFREYTMRELKEMGRTCGLRTAASYFTNFTLGGGRTAIKLATSPFPSFRDTLILVFRKDSDAPVSQK